MRNAAKVIARMDHGHGLVDRFLISAPVALRPTLSEIEAAKQYIDTEAISDFNDYFKAVDEVDFNITYNFEDDAKQLLRETLNQFVIDVNDAITKGEMPPKSKAPDIIPRLATALHVLNHLLEQLLSGCAPVAPPSHTINKSTLEDAIRLVQHLESQKTILCEVTTILINYLSLYTFSKLTRHC